MDAIYSSRSTEREGGFDDGDIEGFTRIADTNPPAETIALLNDDAEAARIAQMCRALDRDVLTSAAFADGAGDARARLVSVGRHALRGLPRKQELFTLDPEIAA